jgi:hypothetical protein
MDMDARHIRLYYPSHFAFLHFLVEKMFHMSIPWSLIKVHLPERRDSHWIADDGVITDLLCISFVKWIQLLQFRRLPSDIKEGGSYSVLLVTRHNAKRMYDASRKL